MHQMSVEPLSDQANNFLFYSFRETCDFSVEFYFTSAFA